MSMNEKMLWVVGYSNLDKFREIAEATGVTGVAIRTDNDLTKAIDAFHGSSIRVFGWRWPSAQRTGAMNEATKVAALFDGGMDGYFVDPEGAPGKPYDWDRPGLEQLASDFCSAISDAAGDRPFGVTSHYRGKFQHPHLPWTQFFEHATVLLPQAYWRVEQGEVGTGQPKANYLKAIDSWLATGGSRDLIVPMAGELAQVTSDEVDAYVAQADALNIGSAHFYAFNAAVGDDVWAAIAAS